MCAKFFKIQYDIFEKITVLVEGLRSEQSDAFTGVNSRSFFLIARPSRPLSDTQAIDIIETAFFWYPNYRRHGDRVCLKPKP
jgi:hypothetical protein